MLSADAVPNVEVIEVLRLCHKIGERFPVFYLFSNVHIWIGSGALGKGHGVAGTTTPLNHGFGTAESLKLMREEASTIDAFRAPSLVVSGRRRRDRDRSRHDT